MPLSCLIGNEHHLINDKTANTATLHDVKTS